MRFIISLHSAGRHLTGAMASTGFLICRYPSLDERDDAEFLNHPDFAARSAEPFLFTGRDDAGALKPGFENWARQGFSATLRDWGRRVIEQRRKAADAVATSAPAQANGNGESAS